ncbi:MAG: hypothetical protein KUG77_05080, partial [Nannocystaceae bacterium]|nr:hypothetical protein [Nannocystaceae bacterium]
MAARVCSHVQHHKSNPGHVNGFTDLDGTCEAWNSLPVVGWAQNRASGQFAQFQVPTDVIGVMAVSYTHLTLPT